MAVPVPEVMDGSLSARPLYTVYRLEDTITHIGLATRLRIGSNLFLLSHIPSKSKADVKREGCIYLL
jgi:hypothetical protein